MPQALTEKEFSKHIKTTFKVASEQSVDLELADVKGYLSNENEQKGMERFSLFFAGPAQPYLAQGTYPIEHEAMGNFELFLVPVSRDEKGYCYEAVFNYFKEKPSASSV